MNSLIRVLSCCLLFFQTVDVFADEPALTIEPRQRLLMEDVAIIASDAIPGGRVTMEATLTDDSGQIWSSRGEYYADHAGTVDLAKSASVGGTYSGADADGLFWSMLPLPLDSLMDGSKQTDADSWPRRANFRSLKAIEVTLSAHMETVAGKSERRKVHADHTIGFLKSTVSRTPIAAHGIRGVLFTPAGEGPFPAIVVVTGSGGGVNERSAALLAAQGFAVLALAHFNYEGRPDELANIPLEYFRTAIDWMKDTFEQDKVALVGGSRGGEGVLLIASTYPERVSAVVAGVPSNVVWGGCCSAEASNQPAWTLAGKPVTAVTYDFDEGEGFDDEEMQQVDLRSFFLPGMLNAEDSDQAVIRVENIGAPILLISGDSDEIWPSSIAADKVQLRLEQRNFQHTVQHLMYSGAGHAVSSEMLITSLADKVVHPVTKTEIPIGGLAAYNAHASKDAYWKKIQFLTEHVAPDSQ